jgi:hypothetical protein
MRVEVLKATSMKMTVFWDVAPCSLVETDRCFMKQPECDCTVGFNFIDFLIILFYFFSDISGQTCYNFIQIKCFGSSFGIYRNKYL